jgi:hypothetical protein
MSETLTMSKKELTCVTILEQVIAGTMDRAEAARRLDFSDRHLRRILARFAQGGAAALVHKLRGRRSNNHCDDTVRIEVLRLHRTFYADFGPTLFCEILATRHGIVRAEQTIRNWLVAAGQWTVATRKHPHRKHRPRREAIGEMVQFDGSPHDWFEGRGPACTLLHVIDDASNRTFLRFAPSENTIDCMRTMRAYIERYGAPQSLYVDFGSVYKDHASKTQFERAMETDLDVRIIHAHSPQAKGRVERGNRTHQDRLVKALRVANISTIDEANAFLDATYLKAHNDRFASTEALPDVHQAVNGRNLDLIFCIQDTRVVANDYTIQLNARYIQLLHSHAPLPAPRQHVIVRQFLDGSLHIYWNDNELTFKHLKEKPRKRGRKTPTPGAQHPWLGHNQHLKSRRITRDTIMTPP